MVELARARGAGEVVLGDVAASPFRWTAVYDGNVAGRPQAGFESEGGLLWHELVRR